MLNKATAYYLLFLFMTCKTISAQITIDKPIVTDAYCNANNELGSISIHVTSNNPPYLYLWSNGETTPTIKNLDAGSYILNLIDGSGADTNIVITINNCKLEAASIFTPNDDGYNDTWQIANSIYYPDARVLVYNRSGQKVFDFKGLYEAWDGKNAIGEPLPDGSYYYIIYHHQKDNESIVKGVVSIVR